MRKSLQSLLILVTCLVLAGCAAMPKRGEFTKGGAAPSMAADDSYGLVTFLRESAFIGGGISYYIHEDGRKIGALRSGTWFMHRAVPGQHTYSAETEAKDFVTINVEAGKNYYVIGSISMGMMAGRPQLKEASEAYAKGLIPNLEYIQRNLSYSEE